jgi:hypothetical protein
MGIMAITRHQLERCALNMSSDRDDKQLESD